MKNIYRHGELILKEVEKIPDGAVLIEETKRKIVAFSETHHHHVLESIDDYKVFTCEGDTYIQLGTIGNLFHEKSGKDVHTPHVVQPAVYKITIKKAYDYFQKKMAQVRD
jgi:hypothetical protein